MKRILYCFFAFILVLLISVEIILGLKFSDKFILGNIMKMVVNKEDSLFYFDLKPNTNIKFSGIYQKFDPVDITISSQGMRDYLYAPNKKDGTFRIAILGDSDSFGWCVELEDTFAKVLERKLKEKGTMYDSYEVMNFSLPGYNTYNQVLAYYNKVINYNPDMLLFFVNHNDMFYSHNELKGRYKLLKYDWFNKLNALFSRRSFLYIALVNYIFNPFDYNVSDKGVRQFKQAFLDIRNIYEKSNTKVLFYPPRSFLTRILAKVDMSANLIDSPGNITDDVYYKGGDSHLNKEGHALAAEEILSYLLSRKYC